MATVQVNDQDKFNKLKLGTIPTDPQAAATNTFNPNAPTSSGRFNNLNQYLQANKSANIGGKIVNKISGQATKLGSQFAKVEKDAKDAALANAAPTYDHNSVSSFLVNPTEDIKDPNKVALFKKMRDAAYTGANSIAGIQAMKDNARSISDLASKGQTEEGRNVLLNNLYGGSGEYSSGQRKLDSLLTGADSSQVSELEQLAPSIKVGGQIDQGEKDFTALVDAYKAQAIDTKGKTKALFGEVLGSIDAQTVKDVKTQNDARDAEATKFINSLSAPTSELLSQLGLDPTTKTYGINDLAKYAKKSTTPLTAQQVLSPEKYAQLQAISKLAEGSLAGTSAQDTLTKLADPAYQGGGKAPAYTFDSGALSADIAANKDEWDQGFGTASKEQLGSVKDIKDVMIKHLPTTTPTQVTDKFGNTGTIMGPGPNPDVVFSNWVEQYKQNPKSFAEDVIGTNQGYSGPDRDAIMAALSKYMTQQGSLNALTAKYKPSSSLGYIGSDKVIAPPSRRRKVVG